MNNETFKVGSLNWDKVDGLMPVVIQDCATLQVLMLGYMNQEALQKTIESQKVTFYSRTKKRLWMKGETSGNDLELVRITPDCDNDTLLVLVNPSGPTCHLDKRSCFGNEDAPGLGMLSKLEATIDRRYQDRPANSYVTQLFADGIRRIAQKVGEEGVEVALASVTGSKVDIKNEVADLLFHILVLLRGCDIKLVDIMQVLNRRSYPSS